MDTSSMSMMTSEFTKSLLSQTSEARLTPQCAQMPIKELSDSTRNFLSKALDPETPAYTDDDCLSMNWRGLAELMDFDAQDIENFEAPNPNANMMKTKRILKDFQTKRGATVEVLWNFLLKLQRFDILDGDAFKNKLEGDHERFLKRQQQAKKQEAQLRKQAEESHPVQVPNVSTNFEEPVDHSELDAAADEYKQMVVDDINKDQKTMFDAFVSYCHDDFDFVSEMIRMVEKVYQLKLCINARDLLPGASTHFVTARLIADRCRKVILVMSPSFLRSPECEFQVKVALSLSPGAKRKILIPILFRHCRMPLVLQHVCLVDYTKSDLAEWFWGRLAASLKESRGEKVLIPTEDLASLSHVEYDLNKDYRSSDQQDINSNPAYNGMFANPEYEPQRQDSFHFSSGGGGDRYTPPRSLEGGNQRLVSTAIPSGEDCPTHELDSRRVVQLSSSRSHHRPFSPPTGHNVSPRRTPPVTPKVYEYPRDGISSNHRTSGARYMSQKTPPASLGSNMATSFQPGSDSEFSDIHIGGYQDDGSDEDAAISMTDTPNFSQILPSNGSSSRSHSSFDLESLRSQDVTIHPLESSYPSVVSGYGDYQWPDGDGEMVSANVTGRMVSNEGYESSMEMSGVHDPPGHYSLPSEPMSSASMTSSVTADSKPKKQLSGISKFFPRGNRKKSKN